MNSLRYIFNFFPFPFFCIIVILHIYYGKFRNSKNYIEGEKKSLKILTLLIYWEISFIVYAFFFAFVLHLGRATQVIHPYYRWFCAGPNVVISTSREDFHSDMAFWIPLHVFFFFLLFPFIVIYSFLNICPLISWRSCFRTPLLRTPKRTLTFSLVLQNLFKGIELLLSCLLFGQGELCVAQYKQGVLNGPSSVHFCSDHFSSLTEHWRLAMCTASVQFPGLRILWFSYFSKYLDPYYAQTVL